MKRRCGGLWVTFVLGLIGACREGQPTGNLDPFLVGVVPGEAGANGCVAEAAVFTAPVEVTLVDYHGGGVGQVTAAGEAEVLYLSGSEGRLWAVDVTAPAAPVQEVLVSSGIINAFLSVLGASVQPQLGGLRAMDTEKLVVMETATHCLLEVDRVSPSSVRLFAGDPQQGAGLVDGPTATARFDLDPSCQPFVSADSPPEVWIPDANNHALRRVTAGTVTTVLGGAGAGGLDGDVEVASLDLPHGLSASCAGTLFILEGGGRLRVLESLGHPLFGWQGGEVSTLAGSGAAATVGGEGLAAGLHDPVSPITSADGEIYWVDAGSGVLRRWVDGTVDCPLAVDCDAAVASPAFTPGAVLSLTRTPSGALFVLDASANAGAGALYFIDN